MDVPFEIRFHNLDASEALETLARERAAKLDRLYERLTSCRVAIEAPHRQHRKGNVFEVHIELGVPGDTLAISHEPHRVREKYASPDAYDSLREAFDAAERQLLAFKDRLG